MEVYTHLEMNRLIVFDLGETLISYEGVPLNWSGNYQQAILNALEILGITSNDDLLTLATSILNFYNTRNSPRLFEVEEGEVLKKVAKVFGADYIEFEALFFSYFQRKAQPEATAEKTLAELKRRGVKLSVLSDVPYGMPKKMLLSDLGSLATWFDDICSSCEVGFRKPHPYGLLHQMQKHHSSKATTIFVGNEAKDIECALNAGVKSILLDPTDHHQFGQTFSVKSLSEVDETLSSTQPGT